MRGLECHETTLVRCGLSIQGTPVVHIEHRYLLDILAEVKGDTVRISFNDASSPSVIHDTSDASAIYVLMPMRV